MATAVTEQADGVSSAEPAKVGEVDGADKAQSKKEPVKAKTLEKDSNIPSTSPAANDTSTKETVDRKRHSPMQLAEVRHSLKDGRVFSYKQLYQQLYTSNGPRVQDNNPRDADNSDDDSSDSDSNTGTKAGQAKDNKDGEANGTASDDKTRTESSQQDGTDGAVGTGSGADAFFDHLVKKYTEPEVKEEATAPNQQPQKKRIDFSNVYDFDDPFIDDSDVFGMFGEMVLGQHKKAAKEGRFHIPPLESFFAWKGKLVWDDDDESSKPKKRNANSRKKATGSSAAGASTASSAKKGGSRKATASAPTAASSAAAKRTNADNTGEGLESESESEAKGKKPSSAKTPSSDAASTAKTNVKRTTPSHPSKSKKKDTTETQPKNKSSAPQAPPATDKQSAGPQADRLDSVAREMASPSPMSPEPSVATDEREDADDEKEKVSFKLETETSAEMQDVLDRIAEAARHESFAQKSKFPPALKPLVLEAGRLDIKEKGTEEVTDGLITKIIAILPYNRFTMRKFVTRHILSEDIETTERRLEVLYLEAAAKIEHMSAQQNLDTGVPAVPKDESSGKEGGDHVRKFKWDTELKEMMYTIIRSDGKVVHWKNRLNEVLGKPEQVSEQTMRKQLYQKLLTLWPQGVMTSYEISVEYSLMKRKVKRGTEPSSPILASESAVPGSTPSTPKKKRQRNVSTTSTTSPHKTVIAVSDDKSVSPGHPTFHSGTNTSPDRLSVPTSPSRKKLKLEQPTPDITIIFDDASTPGSSSESATKMRLDYLM
ncbi:hypothetical protein BZG36_00902 [Bifiguratus adelaidae]|uniref:Ubinuclein middle domain-containing protein n=1 Tax=Bifiguratus adelaidae TaxID=1938954 RepID=A0A261Y5F3_9FUNG|nr:hypothetical protein BZG36_00902 [Bifiguratus adelaidae]